MAFPFFSWRARLRSVVYALAGLRLLLRTQHNAWLHAAATALVLAAGVALDLPRGDWLWLVLAIGLVWMAEALNTALELLGNSVTREHHPLIGQAKDMAAAAVLIAAATAAIIGLLVLGPHVLRLMGAAVVAG